jgi:hypothetical protein
MKLQNGKTKTIMGQVSDNESLSQVSANSVESVSCPGLTLKELSSQDDGRSLRERLSVIDVDANCPTPPPYIGSPMRTPKHKSHNPKRFNVRKLDSKGKKLNNRELMENVMFSPIDNPVDINASVTLEHGSMTSPTIDDLTNLCGDGKSKDVVKCINLRNGCDIHNTFVPADKVVSTITKRIYDVVIAPGEKFINCHSANVVYLLTCNSCSLQYVGETVRNLGLRICEHRGCIRDYAEGKMRGCKRLPEHFNNDTCKGSGFTTRILEKLEGNGRVAPGKNAAMDPNSKRIRLAREKHWMLKLRTVYPFGMNEKVGDEWVLDKLTPVSTKFPKLNRSARVTKGNKSNRNKTLESFLDSLKLVLDTRVKEAMNFLRVFLFSSSKKALKSIYTDLADLLNNCSDPYAQWYKAAHDIITAKIYKEPVVKKRRKTDPNNMVKLVFLNKGLEMINLSKLLHSSSLSNEFPAYVTNTTYIPPTVVYQLTPTIRSNIFNYTKFVKDLDLNKFVDNPNILPCSCTDSPYVDNFHKHIVSGDLVIVPNKELKSMFHKGPTVSRSQNHKLE